MTHLAQFINYADPTSRNYKKVYKDFLWLIRRKKLEEKLAYDDSKIELDLVGLPSDITDYQTREKRLNLLTLKEKAILWLIGLSILGTLSAPLIVRL